MSMMVAALLLAQAGPLSAIAVPDVELATQRGGFQLPNGIDIALTVQTQTSINGAVVLRSEFRVDQGAPTLAVSAPRPGDVVAAETSTRGAGVPTITYDARSGIAVMPAAGPAITVMTSRTGAAASSALQDVAGSDQFVTDNGIVSRSANGGLQTAELRGADLTITHLAGTAFGTAIANSGSDRSIDTQTAVTIDLRNAGPDVLGSAMLRVENVALDALRGRQ